MSGFSGNGTFSRKFLVSSTLWKEYCSLISLADLCFLSVLNVVSFVQIAQNFVWRFTLLCVEQMERLTVTNVNLKLLHAEMILFL